MVEAQWRSTALDFDSKGKDEASRLVESLRRVAIAADPLLTEQTIALDEELSKLTAVLRDHEEKLHELTCILFDLTDEERPLAERGRV